MKERGLSYDDVYWVFKNPDEFHYDPKKATYKYYRYYQGTRLAIVATKNEQQLWVLMTCWFKQMQVPELKRKQRFRSATKDKGFLRSLLSDMWRMLVGK